MNFYREMSNFMGVVESEFIADDDISEWNTAALVVLGYKKQCRIDGLVKQQPRGFGRIRKARELRLLRRELHKIAVVVESRNNPRAATGK